MSRIYKKVEEIDVYTSIDGTKTIYVRKANDLGETPTQKEISDRDYNRWIEWSDILAASRDNTELATLIERAEVYYKLLK